MLKSFLFKVKDHRKAKGKRYELGYILLFTILGILSGANSYRKLAAFMAGNYDKLDEKFGLNWKRTPSYTTIQKIIKETDNEEFEKSFREYSKELSVDESERQQISCDGKVLRHSFDNFSDQKAIQLLSMFLCEDQIILAHEEIDSKTNEIPTAQALIEELGITGSIFTFDAMNCQTETLEIAQETDNDVIVQVKGNQKTLLNDCKTISETVSPDESYQEPVTKTRNRIESRQVEIFHAPQLTHVDKWDTVEAIIKVQRFRQVFDTKTNVWKDSHETAFYISTSIFPAQDFCQFIRYHWGVENRNHYVRDVTLGEDDSRIRCNPVNFARLRSFALNILRRNNVTNVSQTIFENCMNIDNLFEYIGVC